MTKCSCHSHNGFILSPEGLAQRELKLDEVDAMESSQYLDRVGSVSGLELERNLYVHDDDYLDQQYRRFHNGS